ncbi:hypothetical protein Hanom_Chr04g00308891 [Helianthus anomalus]
MPAVTFITLVSTSTLSLRMTIHTFGSVGKLDPNWGDGGLKTYIPKNFYTKTTYITLLSEKFRGRATPAPFILCPCFGSQYACDPSLEGFLPDHICSSMQI